MFKSGKKITRQDVTPVAFWKWFTDNQKRFDQSIKKNQKAAPERLNEIVEELKKYDSWFKALIGKYDDNITELVITADGDIAMFVKVEQLVRQAPDLKGWKFTAHKPALGFDEISINMYDKEFNDKTVKFYPVTDEHYPDQVSIVFTHVGYDEKEKEDFDTATSIYVQNALGELNTATQIDSYEIGPEPEDKSALIPVTKLNDYLKWREKEFVEKYDQASIELPEDTFNTIEGHDAEGNVMLAMVVSGYEFWEYKPAFCWWVRIEMEYEATENGLPDNGTLELLHNTESKSIGILTASPSVLYAASKTFKGCRTTYFYSRDYQNPSMVLYDFCAKQNKKLKLSFFIEKDKYWQSLEEFFGMPEAEEEEEDEEG